MKNRIVLFLILILGIIFFMPNVNAAEKSISFSGSAPAFGGRYQRFFSSDFLSYEIIQSAKIVVNATDGNKLKVAWLFTSSYPSDAAETSATGTLAASNHTHTIYFIPVNKSCPSSGICVKVPKQYSSDGKGNDLTYGIFTGVRFTNESWFYGTLYVNGTITLYY